MAVRASLSSCAARAMGASVAQVAARRVLMASRWNLILNFTLLLPPGSALSAGPCPFLFSLFYKKPRFDPHHSILDANRDERVRARPADVAACAQESSPPDRIHEKDAPTRSRARRPLQAQGR